MNKLLIIVILIFILLVLATANAEEICKLSKQTNVTIASFDKACDDNKFNDIFIGYDIIKDIFERNF